MKYRNENLKDVADDIVNKQLKDIGANGGVIALDKSGNLAMPFNTSSMYRGYLKADETPKVFIFHDR